MNVALSPWHGYSWLCSSLFPRWKTLQSPGQEFYKLGFGACENP